MKKILSAVLVCALLVVSVFALASCGGGLSGKYRVGEETEIDLGVAKITATLYSNLEFSGNTVTSSAEVDVDFSEIPDFIKNLLGENLETTVNDAIEDMFGNLNEATMTGTFEITDDEDGKVITVTYTDEDGETATTTSSFEQGSDDKGNYVAIDGMKFYKE